MAAKRKPKITEPTEAQMSAAEQGERRPTSEFNLLGREDFASDVKESIERRYKKSRRSALVFEQSRITQDYLPIDSLYLQWCIDNRGIEKKTLIELVGIDGTGKTSLFYWLMGGWMLANSPSTLFSGEDKIIKEQWAKLCMSRDPVLAQKMVNTLAVQRAVVLDELLYTTVNQAKEMRDPASKIFVPPHIPIVFAIDVMNKIATQNQVAGMSTGFADYTKSEQSDLGDKGHNWDRARAYHDLINRWNVMIAAYNIVFLVSSHQNDQAVGGAKTGPFASETTKALAHRTKPGGQSINQTNALQLILAPKGSIYCEGTQIAKRVAIKPYKNSYGTNKRECHMAIVSSSDGQVGILTPGIHWDLTMVEWFATDGILGMSRIASSPATAPLYNCADLGLKQSNIIEAAAAIRNLSQSDIEALGCKLKIPGYIDPLGDAVKELNQTQP